MTTTRRDFIKASALLSAATAGALSPIAAVRAFAQSSTLALINGCKETPTLITIFLRGGADPINTIIPYSDKFYSRLRPTIALSHSEDPKTSILPISQHFAFHPAAKPLAQLYNQKLLAPILCVGSKHPTRSHFDAQDFMERAAPGIKTIHEGWLNRFLELTKTSSDHPLRALCMQPILPRTLRGQYPVIAVPDYNATQSIKTFEELYTCDEGLQISKNNSQTSLDSDAINNRNKIIKAGSLAIDRIQSLNKLLQNYNPNIPYPNTNLGNQLKDLAAVIKRDQHLQIASIDYNGWDHHTYQGSTQGVFTNMLTNLSSSIYSFVSDLGPHINNTVILVMSEFGRTVKENGNNGTDHGHGGYMFAIGGPISGKQILGKWTGLDRRNLYQSRDLPVYTDFRDVFSSVLQNLFNFDTDKHNFFPEYDADPSILKLFKRTT
ncbi:DUF1501 domain-containing protein [Planctomycetota bacterium]|nr:DUF1501 domain-containing protein [Planctomycetota bacterium]